MVGLPGMIENLVAKFRPTASPASSESVLSAPPEPVVSPKPLTKQQEFMQEFSNTLRDYRDGHPRAASRLQELGRDLPLGESTLDDQTLLEMYKRLTSPDLNMESLLPDPVSQEALKDAKHRVIDACQNILIEHGVLPPKDSIEE